jgi:hypothetical protein
MSIIWFAWRQQCNRNSRGVYMRLTFGHPNWSTEERTAFGFGYKSLPYCGRGLYRDDLSRPQVQHHLQSVQGALTGLMMKHWQRNHYLMLAETNSDLHQAQRKVGWSDCFQHLVGKLPVRGMRLQHRGQIVGVWIGPTTAGRWSPMKDD